MKTYMALDGLRWSRDSGSVHCNMPRSTVFGRSGGGQILQIAITLACCYVLLTIANKVLPTNINRYLGLR